MRRLGWLALFLAVSGCAVASAGCGLGLSRPPRIRSTMKPADYRAAILRREVVVPTITMLLVILAHGGASRRDVCRVSTHRRDSVDSETSSAEGSARDSPDAPHFP